MEFTLGSDKKPQGTPEESSEFTLGSSAFTLGSSKGFALGSVGVGVLETAGTTLRNIPAGVVQTLGSLAGETQAQLTLPKFGAEESDAEFADRKVKRFTEANKFVSDILPVKELPPEATENEKLIAEGFGPGLGSFAAIAGTAAINPLVALGGLFGFKAGDFRQSALQKGATAEESDKSAELGAVTAPLELLAPVRALKALNSGGFLQKALGELLTVSVEAGQEAFDTFLQNFDAKTLQGFKPDQELLGGTGDAALVGGGVSATAQTLAGLFGLRVRKKSNQATGFETEPLEGDFIPGENSKTLLNLLDPNSQTFENALPVNGEPSELAISNEELPPVGGSADFLLGSDVQGVAEVDGDLGVSIGVPATIAPTNDFTPPRATAGNPNPIAIEPFRIGAAGTERLALPSPTDMLAFEEEEAQAEFAEQQEAAATGVPVEQPRVLPNLTEGETRTYNRIATQLADGVEVSPTALERFVLLEEKVQAVAPASRRAVSEAELDEMVTAFIEGLDLLRSAGRTVIQKHLPREEVEEIVQDFKASNPGAPPFTIFETVDDLPPELSGEVARGTQAFFIRGSTTVEGVEIPARTFFNVNTAVSRESVVRNLLHEDVAHAGIRALIRRPGETPEQLEQRYQKILLGFAKTIPKELAEFNAEFLKFDLTKPAEVARAMDEFIAEIAEPGKFNEKLTRLKNRIIAFFLKVARSLPFVKNSKVARKIRKADIENLLRTAQQRMKQPQNKVVRSAEGVQQVDTLLKASTDSIARMVTLPSGIKAGRFAPSKLREAANKLGLSENQKSMLEYTLRLAQSRKSPTIKLSSFHEALFVRARTLNPQLVASPLDTLQQLYRAAYLKGQPSVSVRVNDPQGLVPHLFPEAVQDASGMFDIPVQASNAELLLPFQNATVTEAVTPLRMAGMSPKDVAIKEYQLDRASWFIRNLADINQMTRANLQVPGSVGYLIGTEQKAVYAKSWAKRADDEIRALRKLPTEDLDSLFTMMMDQAIDFETTGKWLIPLPSTEEAFRPASIADTVKKYNMSDEMLVEYQKVAQIYLEVINELESLIATNLKREFEDNPQELLKRLQELKATFRGYRIRPYAPAIRFGKRTYRAVYATDTVVDGVEIKAGTTFENGAFDSKRLRTARRKELESKGFNVIESLDLESLETGNLGMLNAEFVKQLEKHLELTAKQKAELRELADSFDPVRGMKKHFRKRGGVPGYSTDGMRAFATYMMTVSSALSNIKFRPILTDSLDQIVSSTRNVIDSEGVTQGSLRVAGESVNIEKRVLLSRWYQQHFQYILGSQHESSILSTLAFTNYIWAVPKAALVSVSVIPLLVIPHQTARYGFGETLRASKEVGEFLFELIKNPEFVSAKFANVRRGYETGRREGEFDETLFRELGNATNGFELSRLQTPNKLLRGLQDAQWLGGLPFQYAEKFTRIYTYLSTFILEERLADKEGRLSAEGVITVAPTDPNRRVIGEIDRLPDSLFTEPEVSKFPAHIVARQAVASTLGRFNNSNRPPLGRGSLGKAFFVFLKPVLIHMGNLAGGDKKAWAHMWLALLMLGGVESLPFFGTLADVTDVLVTKGAEALNVSPDTLQLPLNIRQSARQATRRGAESLAPPVASIAGGLGFSKAEVDAINTWMTETLPDSLSGLVATGALGASGIFNIQSSLSLGDPFQLGENFRNTALLSDDRHDPELIGSLLNGFVAPSMLNNFADAMGNNSPDGLENLFLNLPGSRNIQKTIKNFDEGGIFAKGGGSIPIVDFNKEGIEPYGNDYWMSMLGFPSKLIAKSFEEFKAEQDGARYWTARQLDLWAMARQAHTPEDEVNVDKLIVRYNKQIPDGAKGQYFLKPVAAIKGKALPGDIRRDLGLGNPPVLRDNFN